MRVGGFYALRHNRCYFTVEGDTAEEVTAACTAVHEGAALVPAPGNATLDKEAFYIGADLLTMEEGNTAITFRRDGNKCSEVNFNNRKNTVNCVNAISRAACFFDF